MEHATTREAGARWPACTRCVWEAVDAAEQGRHHDVEPLIQKALAIHTHEEAR